jgi:hypothetical protein
MLDQPLNVVGDHAAASVGALTQPSPMLPDPFLLPRDDHAGLYEHERGSREANARRSRMHAGADHVKDFNEYGFSGTTGLPWFDMG